MAFKQLHDYGGRNIIGKIRHHLNRLSAVLFPYKLFHIQLQDICVDNRNIGISRQGILQYGNQSLVDFHSYHFPGLLCQILGHSADAGPYFQHTVLFSYFRGLHYGFQHSGFYQEILTEFFLKIKIVFMQYFNCSCGRT